MADHPKADAPFDDAEDTTEATDEATVPEDAPPVDAPARDWQLKWDERAPVPSETIELRVPAKAYFFFRDWELKDVKALLKILDNHKLSAPFRTPVDWEKGGLTNYLQVVERPMDLGTIGAKLDGAEPYATTAELLAEFVAQNFDGGDTGALAAKLRGRRWPDLYQVLVN